MDHYDTWVAVIETDSDDLSRRKKREQEREGEHEVGNRLKARLRNQALERASEHPVAGIDVLFKRFPSGALALQWLGSNQFHIPKRESYCPSLTRGGWGVLMANTAKTASGMAGFSFGLSDPPALVALTLAPLPGSLSVSKEVFSRHVLRRHHLDRNILLLNGLVGTPGKTLRVTLSTWCC